MSGHVFEHPAGRASRGSVMLVHGSAPFNLDGRTPLAGSSSPYARTSFYRDLSEGLPREGWSVLRYSKPGVGEDGIDLVEYATTDVATLGRQIAGPLEPLADRSANRWMAGGVYEPGVVAREMAAWLEGVFPTTELPAEE